MKWSHRTGRRLLDTEHLFAMYAWLFQVRSNFHWTGIDQFKVV